MYYDVLELDYRIVGLDETSWDVFIKKIKKEYRKIESTQKGLLTIKYKNKRISKRDMQIFVSCFLSDYLDAYQKETLPIQPGDCRKLLPVTEDVHYKTYLFYSTRMAVLQTDNNLRKHLYHSFVDMKAYVNVNNYNTFYLEEDTEDLLEYQRLTYKEIGYRTNIVAYVRECIEKADYVNVHLDEFYLKEKDYYDSLHYVHESMIYGFDDKKQIFYAYGFTKRQKVGKFEISYQEMQTAYEKAKLFYFCGAEYLVKEYPWPVVLSRICVRKIMTDYTAMDLAESLEHFLHPKESEMVQQDYHIYGKNVYEYIYKELLSGNKKETIDFRTFQLLYERAAGVHERMLYVAKTSGNQNMYKPYLDAYNDVIKGFSKMRLLYLKQSMKEQNFALTEKIVKDIDINKRIANDLKQICQREEETIEQFICVAKKTQDKS